MDTPNIGNIGYETDTGNQPMATQRSGGGMTLALRKLDFEIDPQAAKIIVFGRILDEFRKLDLNMPVSQIQAFLMVALDTGMAMSDISECAGIKLSTTSRYLLEMGPPRQSGDANMELVKRSVDPDDNRKVVWVLTPKGRKLVKAICKILEVQGQ
jgi:DNA-binding MarR family transcriptional regulator